ncbi:uncharacterized protein EI97DRAFT_431745 [Westerdykella ornata]|uniref:Flavin reductase like domain-containing protein n=1 Tax=Westerdykella ornata TaxID=318751 RepID=A0A6A6JU10_WESOR|nr:uncharacterized protein EI97DRAFT_431745 [Westerdykella ornata]KAF2278519.1 hypothetical protein EI97DRAFT_431745 [Westerdykella ornata]
MTLSRRASARFFAVFYQWHRCIDGRPGCLSLSSRTYARTFSSSHSSPLSSSTTGFELPRVTQEKEEIAKGAKSLEQEKQDILNGDILVERETQDMLSEDISVEQAEEEEVKGTSDASRGDTFVRDEEALLRGYLETLKPDKITADQKVAEFTEPLSDRVRLLMRRVPHPVVVLTAASPPPHVDAPLGLTVSSFTTVTLDPPIISFNIKHPSQTLDAIRADQGRFRIHFLSSTRQATRIARSFTQGNHEKAFLKRQKLAKMDTSGRDFSRAAHIIHPHVCASMQCELTQEVEVGDHIIAVAKVLSISTDDVAESILTYVGGKFVERPRSELQPARRNTEPRPKHWHPLYSLPLFPGEADREQVREDLIEYVNSRPRLASLSFNSAKVQLMKELYMEANPLGIRLYNLLLEAAHRRQLRNIEKRENLDEHISSLLPCSNRPSPSDMEKVIEKAKKLVQRDPSYLTLPADRLFVMLGLSLQTGTLASDILNPLRADGLIPPFQPVDGPIRVKTGREGFATIHHFEQLEHKMRVWMQTAGSHKSDLMGARHFSRELCDNGTWATLWASQVHTRIYMDTFPDVKGEFEFSGHLGLPQARVAVSRIFAYLHKEPSRLAQRIRQPWRRILWSSGVHPLVTGFDPVFFCKRLQYWFLKHPLPDYSALVRKLKDSHFVKTVSVDDLQWRADEVVDTALVQAVDWSRSDLFRALGLHPEARLVLEDGSKKQITLLVVGRALHNALRHRQKYEKFYDLPAEERKAVERFTERFGAFLLTGKEAERLSGLPKTAFPEDEEEFVRNVEYAVDKLMSDAWKARHEKIRARRESGKDETE